MKFAIVGAGSSYTPELLEEMANRKETLPVKEIVLYDIDERRLQIMEGFCKRFAARLGLEVSIRSTLELDDALYGADFVDTQIRVGGNAQRVVDEKIPLKYGLVGQETTGAGGMMKAFRTIPVMLNVARHMEQQSPDGWIINYTNPTGLVTEAVTRYTKANIAASVRAASFPRCGRRPRWAWTTDAFSTTTWGLNHMNFISNITIDGRPITQEEFEKLAVQNESVDPELSKLLGVLTSPYLQWYYQTSERVKGVLEAPYTRGEYVQMLEKEIFAAYADPNNDEKPAALAKRGGGGYSEVAMNFVNAVYNNVDTEMVVNVPNGGAVPFCRTARSWRFRAWSIAAAWRRLHVGKVPPMCWA